MTDENGSQVNVDKEFVVLSCPTSSSSLSCDEAVDLSEGSAAKKARREEDPEQDENREWGNVAAGIKEQVGKLLEFKRKDYENLLEEETRLKKVISEKKTLFLANKLQIEQGVKERDARVAQFKNEEETIKELLSSLEKRMETLQEEKERFVQEYQLEFCDAKDNQDELDKEWTSLYLKKNNIELKLKRFKEVSLAKDETRRTLQRFIKEKEEDVECPVCLEEAAPPIFSCKEMHIICCSCREQVVTMGNRCPVCRVKYGKNKVRHRFAEKICEELRRMRKELADLE
eukprot:GFUD01119307.1.p1 GENE.GFUD01119307.1~~GFUD01119307.1.p1  ORF type:complete len:287 (+),score=120.67 GFUD01119307.1:63-923(+)